MASIRWSIEQTLAANPTGLSPADQNVFLIRQTALEYLPRALNAYLALPRVYAERRAVADGRTPHDELLAQLQLLNRKMQEVADNIAKRDTDRLLANGRFLQERFAPSSLDVQPGRTAEAPKDAVRHRKEQSTGRRGAIEREPGQAPALDCDRLAAAQHRRPGRT